MNPKAILAAALCLAVAVVGLLPAPAEAAIFGNRSRSVSRSTVVVRNQGVRQQHVVQQRVVQQQVVQQHVIQQQVLAAPVYAAPVVAAPVVAVPSCGVSGAVAAPASGCNSFFVK